MQSNQIFQESGPYGTTLVRHLEESEQLVNYQLLLLIRQRPDFLLPGYLRYRGNRPEICLDITGLRPLDQAFSEHSLTPDCGRAILQNIFTSLVDAADRLLPIHQFLLNSSQIYLKDEHNILLAFWPVHHDQPADHDNQFCELLRTLGQAFKIPENEIIRYQHTFQADGLYKTYQLVCSEKENKINRLAEKSTSKSSRRFSNKLLLLSFGHLLGILLVLYEYVAKPVWSDKIRTGTLMYMLFLLIFDVFQLVIKINIGSKLSKFWYDIQAKTVKLLENMKRLYNKQGLNNTIGDDGQTVLISADPADFRMALLSEGLPGTPEENEGLRAYILVDEFIIGRDQKSSDLCLTDPGIGRQHARILRRAGSFFICDLGSRNGTSLDGRRLLKNNESLLPDQCQITFAGHSFYFQAD